MNFLKHRYCSKFDSVVFNCMHYKNQNHHPNIFLQIQYFASNQVIENRNDKKNIDQLVVHGRICIWIISTRGGNSCGKPKKVFVYLFSSKAINDKEEQ